MVVDDEVDAVALLAVGVVDELVVGELVVELATATVLVLVTVVVVVEPHAARAGAASKRNRRRRRIARMIRPGWAPPMSFALRECRNRRPATVGAISHPIVSIARTTEQMP